MRIWVVIVVDTSIYLLASFADQLANTGPAIANFNHARRFLSSIANHFPSVALFM